MRVVQKIFIKKGGKVVKKSVIGNPDDSSLRKYGYITENGKVIDGDFDNSYWRKFGFITENGTIVYSIVEQNRCWPIQIVLLGATQENLMPKTPKEIKDHLDPQSHSKQRKSYRFSVISGRKLLEMDNLPLLCSGSIGAYTWDRYIKYIDFTASIARHHGKIQSFDFMLEGQKYASQEHFLGLVDKTTWADFSSYALIAERKNANIALIGDQKVCVQVKGSSFTGQEAMDLICEYSQLLKTR